MAVEEGFHYGERQESDNNPRRRTSRGSTSKSTAVCRMILTCLFGFWLGCVVTTSRFLGSSTKHLLIDNFRDDQDNHGQRTSLTTQQEESSPHPDYPSNLFVRGRRDYYTPCPPEFRKRAHVDLITDQNIHRAYRWNGWEVSNNANETTAGAFHVIYKKRSSKGPNPYTSSQPWQRYSKLPGFSQLESKDNFIAGFRNYAQHQDDIYFLPETYRLSLDTDRHDFQSTIERDRANGQNRPWVLKNPTVNNGKGVEMLAPNSPELFSAVDKALKNPKRAYIAQAYVCNELTWFGGEKFDMRFFWFVASVDPLIVLYQDGYVRVGGALYNESDFQSTGQHLTNHEFRTVLDDHVTADDLWRRVRDHYEQNKERLSKIIIGNDPVKHVRNQLKEAISTTAEAFPDALSLTGPKSAKQKVTMENLFGFFGCDFIIDQDLDVFYIEAQVSPGMGQSQDFRIDVFRRLLRPVVNLVEEIAVKQAANASANLFPLENMGDYNLVYVGRGGPGSDTWRYRYKGYKRSKHKKGCALPTLT